MYDLFNKHLLSLQVEIHSQAAQSLALSLRRLSIHYMQKLLLLVEQSVSQWHSWRNVISFISY